MRQNLIRWYDTTSRPLPWRRPPPNFNSEIESEQSHEKQQHAYKVWVSEVMLQQTQVCTVIDYYNKWIEKWPTVQDLAEATQEEVNDAWAGLGYYRRAKYLLKGAQHVIRNEQGQQFPSDNKLLQKIPGIGPYTAGAVASIVFGKNVPAVDGNVIRVISRLGTIGGDPKQSSFTRDIEDFTCAIQCQVRPGDFNQALMELGATICKPTNPQCNSCPLNQSCRAYLNNVIDQFPPKAARTKKREESVLVCVMSVVADDTNEQFIMVQRKEDGLLGGLWEWPSILLEEKENLSSSIYSSLLTDYMKNQLDMDIQNDFQVASIQQIGQRTHIFSHINQQQIIFAAQLNASNKQAWSWIDKGSQQSKEEFLTKQSRQKIRVVLKQDVGNGLTSGVKKALELYQKSQCKMRNGKQSSITQFFKG
eukprot:TRINITY_DN2259_c0_g1_i2.p1 TRINITY_DN2259_c0_g1~~TRINITY_DN2259_c0_g1_i2.p1  ORF type:complete len:419 (+),score=47.54 TRINITY_DN2259_c0_g1_i2:2-1258(+)